MEPRMSSYLKENIFSQKKKIKKLGFKNKYTQML